MACFRTGIELKFIFRSVIGLILYSFSYMYVYCSTVVSFPATEREVLGSNPVLGNFSVLVKYFRNSSVALNWIVFRISMCTVV